MILTLGYKSWKNISKVKGNGKGSSQLCRREAPVTRPAMGPNYFNI